MCEACGILRAAKFEIEELKATANPMKYCEKHLLDFLLNRPKADVRFYKITRL